MLSQVRIGPSASAIQASRIGSGETDVLIGTDLVVSAGDDTIARLSALRSAIVLNEDLTPTAAIVRQRDAELPREQMRARMQSRSRPDAFHAFSASSLTKAVFGESTGSHVRGRPRKIRFGPWIFSAFAVLARMRGLRGTRFDPFGLNPERAAERKLLEDYLLVIDELANRLKPCNLNTALALAALPDQVRGYGPVKMQAIAEFDAAKERLLRKFRAARSIPISSAACG
ncbi:hypothetical protein LJR084_007877 [Variovorax sp. LjRoot84]|uniref:DUF6537 domain-containing protein n=1 Tax=Variovorax sp. LjRoot84 TaxID=3342340 RepID=UPI003ED08075